ncbi:hypothetical protein GN956_G20187 [Arapaima gigas]
MDPPSLRLPCFLPAASRTQESASPVDLEIGGTEGNMDPYQVGILAVAAQGCKYPGANSQELLPSAESSAASNYHIQLHLIEVAQISQDGWTVL